MNPPSAEIQWISFAGTVLANLAAFASLIYTVYVAWRNRERMIFNVQTADLHFEIWHKYELPSEAPREGEIRPCIHPGDCKRYFAVLEFIIKNQYKSEIKVGRFIIDDWIFADRYRPEMYSPPRDYRVFDLYSRQERSLDSFWPVASKGTLGLRVEILQETVGPRWISNHSRYVLDLPKHWIITYFEDNKTRHRKIRLYHHAATSAPFSTIYTWSDLIGKEAQNRVTLPVPQGIIRPVHHPYRQRRVHNRLKTLVRKIRRT